MRIGRGEEVLMCVCFVGVPELEEWDEEGGTWRADEDE